MVEPQREGILDHPGYESGHGARRQTFLGLAGELRFQHLHRQHIGNPFPEVFGGQLHPTRQQAAVFAEFTQRLQHAGSQTVHVRSAQWRGDQVDVALEQRLAAFGKPLDGPVHRLFFIGEVTHEGRGRQYLVTIGGLGEIVAQAILELPYTLGAIGLDERHLEPRAEHCLGPQQMLEPGQRQLRRVEIARFGPEAYQRARGTLGGGTDHRQVGGSLAMLEGHVMATAILEHFHLEAPGQGIDHRDTDAVQPTGKAITGRRELSAGVQLGHDQLDPGDTVLGMNVDGHAATVVADLDAAVLEQAYGDRLGMAAQRLVDTVVDDFLDQMVGPGSVGVHAGALAHGLEPGKHLDRTGAVLCHASPRLVTVIRLSPGRGLVPSVNA
ncbi:hypothetical protein A8U91_01929 [Halomonas elongata]|uniref:Uncharacterized protein n=1 Tax=Halomonas elongata TaxID=2746 RepID=A0A1B8P5L5_HALEL|nr:hypothetical protein A8U91_01929 [Halomonas elongata]